ncbi:SufD family Fe-S cluster assembly protein [Candidatus Peregrinibacteria bacterium]|nr:SufD family Fe-S cluster assembly protein [Candidatus Peregrinibacteria bacterium]
MPDVTDFIITINPEDKSLRLAVTYDKGTATVRAPEGARFRHPVRVRWKRSRRDTAINLTVGKGATVCVIEEIAGARTSHAAVVRVEAGANVEFISINRMSSNAAVQITQRSHLGDNAAINWRNITLGSAKVTHDILSELAGEDATSGIDWMFYAKGDETYRLRARNVFNGKRGRGEIIMKGVAGERGHVRCDGMIKIGEGGSGTGTRLTQDVLMLDKTAKVDAIPALEIKTNDVKASHSAAVSHVTNEDMFYFAARGVGEREARRMFVEGFLWEMTAKIGDRQSREKLLEAVERKCRSR